MAIPNHQSKATGNEDEDTAEEEEQQR